MAFTEEQRYWLERDFVVDLLKQLPLYVFWKNTSSIYLGCNDAFAHSAGLSKPEDIIGKTDYDLPTTKEESDAYRADDQAVMKSRQPRLNIEEPQTLANGKKIVLLTSKVPLLDKQNNVVGVLGIYTDITQRKQMEEQLRISKEMAEAANKAKSVFIANMSHDIRTPISGVINMASMLEREGDTPKDREYARVIHDSGSRLLSLLDDILVMASADEASEETLELETFSLFDRLEHVSDLFTAHSYAKNIEFDMSVGSHLPHYIVSDRLKIDRILLNLVGNALKFTDKGYIKFHVEEISRQDEKSILKFVISDSGIGIPQNKLEHIFDRFYRESPSYEGKYGGHGIGLFIVKKFVTLLSGEIHVMSELGKGTQFEVILPVKMATKQDAKKPEKDTLITRNLTVHEQTSKKTPFSRVEKNQNNKLRVLFIEDDAIARQTGQYFLEAAGLEVYSVSGAEEAFKAVKSNIFDLIITDIGLPNIDGYEFTLLMRYWEKKSNRKPLPIIGLSAHLSHQITEAALDIGMSAVLEKPINDSKIENILSLAQNNFNYSR